jgi:tRNA wybutosine-synthesizing protein 2
MKTPYERIVEIAKSRGISAPPPKHWEILGDVVVLKAIGEHEEYEQNLGEIYAEVLGAKTVVVEEGIYGLKRKPEVRVIYGKDTETIAKENGILYKLDVSKVMFSSGNKKERMRMGSIVKENERVLDMFAGIGYFSIPIGKKAEVYSCEINREAFHYLCENAKLNKARIKPFLGDNREIAPSLNEKFDRIVMGYLKGTHEFLPIALNSLKESGVIHYHEAFRDKEKVLKRIDSICKECGREIKEMRENRIKSIAPHIEHYVFDLVF